MSRWAPYSCTVTRLASTSIAPSRNKLWHRKCISAGQHCKPSRCPGLMRVNKS
jgi:hypothetical protein